MSLERVLFDILAVLVAAKLASEVAERIGIPGVLGEILIGIVIGPSALGLVGRDDDVLRVLGEIGVILLLLDVGLEMDLGELAAVGRASLSVATIGVVVPFASGTAVSIALGHGGRTAVFIGAALTATSVGITARVFGDLRALATVEARTVLGAAVADDVLGLVILTVVVRLVTTGSVSAATIATTVGLAIGFLVFTTFVGVRIAPALFGMVKRWARTPGTLVALALAFTLACAELAQLARLAPIVGAFVAGLALGRSDQADRIRGELRPVGHLFVPVFFLQIGIDADIGAMVRPSVLAIAGGLLVVAVAGKIVAAVGALGAPGDKPLIGLAMIPRGEVGLIFAGLGLREGVLNADLYAALLLVVLATTLVTPPLMKWRLTRLRSRRKPPPSSPEPAGGWLVTSGGVVDLAAEPPDHRALLVALRAAREVGHARPSQRLLEWLGRLGPDVALRWDPQATAELLVLLPTGTARSWRLLQTVGVLERALPELAAVVARRQADPFQLDPAGVLRWALVERLHDQTTDPALRDEHAKLAHPERLLLAALLVDAGDDADARITTARALVKRLDLGAAAEEEVALLVGENGLLGAAARRPDALKEEYVLTLATHLESPERARALYLSSMATGGMSPPVEARLSELHRRIQVALADPELTSLASRNLVEQRRREAARLLGTSGERGRDGARLRIETFPRAWVLAQESLALVRQAKLAADLRRGDPPRATVSGGVQVEVVGRGPDLLARVAAALTACGADVSAAGAGAWPDGVTVIAATVTAAEPLDAERLARAVEQAEVTPRPAAVQLRWDDDGSPWTTRCEVHGANRPGLLADIASALASVGVRVHSFRAFTTGDQARDHFELTGRADAKLDDADKARVEAALAGAPPVNRSGHLGWLRLRRSRRAQTTRA